MTTTTDTAYTLVLPEPVRDFFTTLTEFGQVVRVREDANGVILRMSATGNQSLGARLLLLAQSLGEKGLTPAFPPYLGWGYQPSTRWTFGDPTETAEGDWDIPVPITADLLHLLGVVSGLGSYPSDFTGGPVLPVTLYPENARDLTETVHEIENELTAWFGVLVRLDPADA